jgi:hypothetical protein
VKELRISEELGETWYLVREAAEHQVKGEAAAGNVALEKNCWVNI